MISVIFLAGGRGTRMQSHLPKQFLSLNDRCIAHYALDVFMMHPEVYEIIVVCAPEYRHFFSNYNVLFAEPGELRQQSLIHGLRCVSEKSTWIATHDAARPFISQDLVSKIFKEGKQVGAASLATPVKTTIKEITEQGFVQKTVDRNTLWEIQTPQLIEKSLLKRGIAHAEAFNLTVTDDVAFVELIGHPVKLVLGCYRNLKITTPEDLQIASTYLSHAKI